VLIEHYAGAFPLWLSPEQVRLLPVADRHVAHAQELAERFRAAGLRPLVDDSAESVGKKVRTAQVMKAPYTLVIGDREIESGLLTVRDRSGAETKGVSIDGFVGSLVEEARTRSLGQRTFEG
jgi:threonyl-tRNA synthetase